ncbi:MAG: hypothetical protein WC455_19225 [Dehalococcoidia bacterium]|jgi:hypothetical protein
MKKLLYVNQGLSGALELAFNRSKLKKVAYVGFCRPLPKWAEKALSKLGINPTGVSAPAFNLLMFEVSTAELNRAVQRFLLTVLKVKKEKWDWESVNRDMVE